MNAKMARSWVGFAPNFFEKTRGEIYYVDN